VSIAKRYFPINLMMNRVSQERREPVGQTVGYHVGMQSLRTKGVTKIMYMTTGIFLQRLVNNPESLKRCTHVILDEVHERDLDIDFALVVLKHLLVKEGEGYNFKLVLMSATFNTELFANYFSQRSVQNIEGLEVYVGAEERRRLEEEKQRLEMAKWRGCKTSNWASSFREKE